MALRLAPEDKLQYDTRLRTLEMQKQYAIKRNDTKEARLYRRLIGQLYNEFLSKQLPDYEAIHYKENMRRNKIAYEAQMTVEERLDRIEQTLKIGLYEPEE